MAKKDTADILALGDKEESPKQEYDVSGLAGLVKSKFIDAENSQKIESKINDFKVVAEASLREHLDKIVEVEKEDPDYLEDLIEEAKEEVQKIEKETDEVNVSDSESEITTGVMMTATVVEVSPHSEHFLFLSL